MIESMASRQRRSAKISPSTQALLDDEESKQSTLAIWS